MEEAGKMKAGARIVQDGVFAGYLPAWILLVGAALMALAMQLPAAY